MYSITGTFNNDIKCDAFSELRNQGSKLIKHILGYFGAVFPMYAASKMDGWISILLFITGLWLFGFVMFSDWFNDRTPTHSESERLAELDTEHESEDCAANPKVIVICSECSQKLGVPTGKTILVTCSSCGHKFQVGG